MRKISLLLALLLTASALTCCTERRTHADFERSYWIDIDLMRNNQRGYWLPYQNCLENPVPTAQDIENSCKELSDSYYGDKIYVTYHRQFEIETCKEIWTLWKKYGEAYGLTVVPAVVLESYATPTTMNFTDEEICDLVSWSLKNINEREFGIYDVYIRQEAGSAQDLQMAALKDSCGDCLVRIGLQPGESLNANCKGGVEDTWTAECQGLTNELWATPAEFQGNVNYGKTLLESWIMERVDGENRRIVWDMIPVAWDYEKPLDEYGYLCPGDDALINDPPVEGRIALCHSAIVACYPEGMSTVKFGGYSCDLHILNANSAGKPDAVSFYDCLRAGKPYDGYFASAMEQIAELYKSLR